MSHSPDTARDDSRVVPHTPLENVLGVLIGTYVVSLGLFLLTEVGAVTGGTAGLSLVIGYALNSPFGLTFFLVNVPFFALAWVKKGVGFTVRSAISVALVSGFAEVHKHFVDISAIATPYAIVTGNALVGIGLLILFRHGSSLGGFNIVALLAQERLGWRAGYVQLVLDVVVVVAGLAVAPPAVVLMSAGGAAILNLILALNHKPGRYLGM